MAWPPCAKTLQMCPLLARCTHTPPHTHTRTVHIRCHTHTPNTRARAHTHTHTTNTISRFLAHIYTHTHGLHTDALTAAAPTNYLILLCMCPHTTKYVSCSAHELLLCHHRVQDGQGLRRMWKRLAGLARDLLARFSMRSLRPEGCSFNCMWRSASGRLALLLVSICPSLARALSLPPFPSFFLSICLCMCL